MPVSRARAVRLVLFDVDGVLTDAGVYTGVDARGRPVELKRFEDARFLRGRGNYFDDITLPGMLHLEFLRSPLAHARINGVDTSRAAAVPGVVAVLTGPHLQAYLHGLLQHLEALGDRRVWHS